MGIRHTEEKFLLKPRLKFAYLKFT